MKLSVDGGSSVEQINHASTELSIDGFMDRKMPADLVSVGN
jgi:hypothetical protein